MKVPIQSFAGRLTRQILLLWILVMALIAAVIFIKAESGMSSMSDNHYSDVLDLTNEKVQGILRDSFADMQASLADYVRELTATTAQKASMES